MDYTITSFQKDSLNVPPLGPQMTTGRGVALTFLVGEADAALSLSDREAIVHSTADATNNKSGAMLSVMDPMLIVVGLPWVYI